MASVRHATSVQGADDPGKSVQAAQWNEDQSLVGVADQTSLDAVSAAVSVVAANLSALSVTVAGISGGEVHPTSAEFVSLAADHSVLSIQVTNVSAAISVVAANLSNEISLRASQINTASGAVSTLSLDVSVVAAALSNETSARIAGDNAASGAVSTLSLALSAETAARIAGDNTASGAVSTLSLAVSVVAAALSNEISLRSSQINTASGAVSTLSLAVSVVAAGLSNEISARNATSNAISTMSLAVSAAEAHAAAASAAVSTLSLAVSVVAAQLSATSVQVTAVSAAVSVVAAGLSALSIQVSTLSAQMTSLVASKIVMLGAQTISVSALTNVSGQAFSVGANNTYAFKYMIIYQAASTATGLGVSVTFPGMKTFAATAYITSGATGTANTFSGPITASGTKIQALSCQTAATDFYAVIEGAFQVSTSGTLQLQADSGVGGTSAQVIIRPGTFGMVWRGA